MKLSLRIAPLLICVLSPLAWAAVAQTTPVPPVATDEPAALRDLSVIPPRTADVPAAQQAANARIVMQWHYEFFDLGHFRQAADKYLAADFQQNDQAEASGRDNYVAEFEHNGYVPRAASTRPPKLAVFTSGDLVLMVIPEGWPRPKGQSAWSGAIHCNMFQVRNGKIVAMWVSGDVATAAAAAVTKPAK